METDDQNQAAVSAVSLKSNTSMRQPPALSDETVTFDLKSLILERKERGTSFTMTLHEEREGQTQTGASGVSSCVSLKSNDSMRQPPILSNGTVTSDPKVERDDLIRSGNSSETHLTQAVLQEETGNWHKQVNDELQKVKYKQKNSMKIKYERLFEGNKLQENETSLNRIYTQLYIIEGESEVVNEEHEVLQMEKTARTQHSQDTPIYCNDIFKASPEPGCEEKDQIKTVLTKGIAGIGKTVSVQKFILDWAEGKANQDVDFMFVLPFRELNLIRDHQYSLHRLLLDFHPELQDLDSKIYEECKVVFIFDGLDESRITLMFSDDQKVCDVTETSSVSVLMSNLMKGELLPSALIWITSRPAAANQIPSKYINRLTEIQGFSETQKEEYFRKRISDQHQASRIISHIRRARSLHIMCHIPVFCWISSTVLQKLLKEDLSAEIPQTLTEMYIHFLLIQINMRNQKYEERDPEKLLQSNREVIVKLAEVAFKQLMKGNVMFYEEDLIESGIDVTDASVYSGICTEIFKEESVIHQRKIYSFIHLSIQEFLAAFHVFYNYTQSNTEALLDSLHNLHKRAVDKACFSKNGHLDLFLRFLLGVSLESNQRLLQDLLTHTENSSESIRRTTQYIKEKIKDGHGLSTERSINLFLCLLEVKDQTLSREIQEFVKSDKHSEKKLSPAHCSTIAYMLQMSEEVLDELDLKKYNTTDEGRRRLIPAVINCRKSLFPGCSLTSQDYEIISSALQSYNSVLRELDLSNNDLQDSGVKIISDGLKSPNCQLEILRLSGCMVTEEGCGYLSSALSSNPSHLRELDLSYNHPGQSGVQLLKHRLEDPNCALQKLNLDHGGPFAITAGLRKSSPEPSCVSMKSDASIIMPPNISNEAVTSDPRLKNHETTSLEPSCVKRNTGYVQKPVNDERVKYQHKTSMKNKYERLFEGNKLHEDQTFLNRIYTQLYIIEGESEGVNEEHEVLQMEKTAGTQHSQDTPIYCNNIFKASPEPGCEEKHQIKTVLTKGIAGIGKTVSVQKFILDWAEGKANQDVDFMFVLPFRELNLIRDHQYSLHRLLLDFHPELQDLDSKIYEECKVVFIFDGLDESRITLMFSDDQKVCDVTETSSVGVLMSNLMKGELLPSALIWITSRPAAANQIPSKYINCLTEIQGFNEPQKEEYFRKRISDQHQASRIISHIRRARSLHIMCHIPVFCWISSTVLQKLLKEDLSAEIPQTLTEMYIHFLLIQINMRNQKYEERDPEKLLQSNREVIVKLAEVAFKQLMKGNVMFYEEDLIESGIYVTDASVYSGICTEIFKEESVIHQKKVYSFIHLSIQEFLSAFYVFYYHLCINTEACFDSLYKLNERVLDKSIESENGHLDLFLRFLLGVSLESNQRLLQDLLTHTENSSESIRRTTQYIKEKIKDGHGLSTERSINLFLCLLEVKDQALSREIQEFVKSDKHSEKKLSPAHCSTIAYMLQMSEEVLDELDLKKYNTSDEGRRRLIPAVINCRKALLPGCNLTVQDCEILSSALQSSNSVLRELDLSGNDLQDSGVKIISEGLKSPNCQLEILRLSGCMVTKEGCGYLSSALSSNPSHLRELDLSYNHPGQSGAQLLKHKLEDPNYKLQILNLTGCNLTGLDCEIVSLALQSSNSALRELDLSNNDMQDSGLKLLSNGMKSPNCQLEKLRLSGCMVTEEGCVFLSSALSSNPSHLRELDLSYNHPGQSGVQLLKDKLEDPNYKLQILNLYEEKEEERIRKVSFSEPSCVSMKSNRSIIQPPALKNDYLQRVKDQHKTNMKNKYERLFEGNKLQDNETLLNRIYTQLYIIEGESEGVNEEHEVLQMEKTARTQHSQDTPIYCNDIFKASPEPGCEEKDQIKTVLTKGIAGIGKTISVQKFILDWAEGKANQDVDFMFVLPFRELNLIRDHQYSLHRLLLDFHPELQDLDSKIYEECKVVFIFDGLDESRITRMFSDDQKVCDVTETSSVSVLMSNLMKGELLPSALIWITSRPAAANQIPSKYINRLTEIQGFNEPQKEEYFRKRISDQHQASRIISHIRRARSLHIMCHIPAFCWISSTVLQKLLKEDLSAEIPQTLTEMYIHFLLIQINMRNQKYEERDPEKLLQSNREVIVKLAKVAFKQLMKGNVMFYEEDLIESGIDVTDASVYSGICTEIFKEESVIHQRNVYSFIHLSIQEFLAAFYVFYFHVNTTMEGLRNFALVQHLLKVAVDTTFESENGHLDLFLRFLLGISLESNQRLLQDLLTHTENSSESIRRTTQYIKEKIKDGHGLSTERSINLFLCLLEVKDQTLSREIQEFVKSDKHSEKKLSPAHCSTIAYMLQMSEEVLDELDLKTYNTSDEGRRRLIPAVINCRKALLAGCILTAQDCEIVSSALQSSNCVLRELDLSNNDLQDSGVKLLSNGLMSPNCQLEILRLSGCMVTKEGCGYLSSALSSNPSHLRELDLSYNHPGQSGVQLLKHKLEDPNYKLQILNLNHGGPFRIKPRLQKYACDLTLDPNTAHTQLMLSDDNRKITYVEEQQPYPDHPERFAEIPQVLCRESLTGRCYWEVEWGSWARIAVAYKGISRKEGTVCKFGYNDKSWSLFCTASGFAFWHNNVSNKIPIPLSSKRVGVYLDWLNGTLSYYSVSDAQTLTHLHTFNTTFTEPLYAGFK
ncbi:hypothetical protein QQF64_000357, partial [Cirrhinus molitorella]